MEKIPNPWPVILQYTSYILFPLGMILGSRFNKSKVFFLCLILGLSQLALSYDGLILGGNNEVNKVFDTISFLIPINILLFSILRERGILTPWGKIRFGFILFQIFLIWWITKPSNNSIQSLISHKIIDLEYGSIIPMPQISILLFFLTFLLLSIRMFIKPTLMDSSFIGVVLAIFSGLFIKDKPLSLDILFSLSGLILIIGIIESSYSMAYSDQLTKIPARRALMESLMKLGNRYTIAMIDIDFFKKFNDKYGHDAGDEVLKMVASILKNVNGGGRAFRYGGEEFTILFPGKTMNRVIPHLEELRETIEKEQYMYKKKRKVKGKKKIVSKKLCVTVSIGVAEKNDKYKTPKEVMKGADKALYRAKKKGRNCVKK